MTNEAMMRLDEYFFELQSALPADGPGFSALVVREGEVAFELHHGLASLELEAPLSARSAYYLASESKQFMAAAILTLVRAGTIGLDDDVCAHLPELAGFEQPFACAACSITAAAFPTTSSFCSASRAGMRMTTSATPTSWR